MLVGLVGHAAGRGTRNEALIMTEPIYFHMKENPEASEWTLHVADIQYNPGKNKEPNWFHRKMQHLILGFRWEK